MLAAKLIFLIIGEDEDDIGPFRRLVAGIRRGDKQERKGDGQSEEDGFHPCDGTTPSLAECRFFSSHGRSQKVRGRRMQIELSNKRVAL
jgi:hypothetical protein